LVTIFLVDASDAQDFDVRKALVQAEPWKTRLLAWQQRHSQDIFVI